MGRTAPATDPDGNVYRTLKIGDQVWFTENLRTTKYSDGSSIAHVTDNAQWDALVTGGYCWFENNNIYEIPYGKLYNWYAVDDQRSLCPVGWRIPTVADFNTLIEYLGGTDLAGGKLKQEGTETWSDPNTGATNSSGFTAVGSGNRGSSGTWTPFFGYYTTFWGSNSCKVPDTVVSFIPNNPKTFEQFLLPLRHVIHSNDHRCHPRKNSYPQSKQISAGHYQVLQ